MKEEVLRFYANEILILIEELNTELSKKEANINRQVYLQKEIIDKAETLSQFILEQKMKEEVNF